MTPQKRAFDLVLLLLALPLALPLLALLLGLMALCQGRPFFYVSERMLSPTQGFYLIKLRSMHPVSAAENSGVSGGDKAARITRLGAILRRSHLDELPQLWNVMRGELSFVGPRPPLRQYIKSNPELYDIVLKNRPGITGLATLIFHRHEACLLAACTTPAQTEATYTRRCIPRKARIDLLYQERQSLCLDLWLIGRTIATLLRPRV